MKFFANLLVVCGAGAFGYFAEPSLRLELTGISPTPPVPQPQPANQEELLLSKVNLMGYAPEQLPKEVTLKKDAQVTDASSGLKMTIPAQSRVKMLRLDTGMVIVGTGAPNIEGAVEVQDTDIREQLITNPPAAVATAPEKPPGTDAMAKNEPAEGAAAPQMDQAAPAETAGADPNMKAPTEGSNPALAPAAPAEPAAPAAEFAPLSADDIVKTMQDSLKSSEIKELKFDQVTEWAGAEPEEVDGKKFNIGLVTYKAQTILGLKSRQAKAYIQGGKVIRWVNPKSGTDIQ